MKENFIIIISRYNKKSLSDAFLLEKKDNIKVGENLPAKVGE